MMTMFGYRLCKESAERWMSHPEERLQIAKTVAGPKPARIYVGDLHVASVDREGNVTIHSLRIDEAKIAAIIETWKASGMGMVLENCTDQEVAEIFRQMDLIARAMPRRLAEQRVVRVNGSP